VSSTAKAHNVAAAEELRPSECSQLLDARTFIKYARRQVEQKRSRILPGRYRGLMLDEEAAVPVVSAAEIFSKNWQLLSVLPDTSGRGSCAFAPIYPDQANARIVHFRLEISQSTRA
jgi:hypothetical protein